HASGTLYLVTRALLSAPHLPVDCPPLPGWHRLERAGGRVVLDLLLGEALPDAVKWRLQADALLLNGTLSPQACVRLARPGALLLAPEVDAAQRRAFEHAEFHFEDGAQARYAPRRPPSPEPLPAERHAIVIGAGLAGASACERLAARGWRVTLLEREAAPARQASGNRAGIFLPVLSRDDNPASRLTRAAYLYAQAQWPRFGGLGHTIAGAQCGVLQLARDADHADVQRRIAARWRYPADYARWLDAGEIAGVSMPHGAWLYESGGWLEPASLCRAWLAACGDALTARFDINVAQLTRDKDQWQARDAAGALLAEAPVVIVATGAQQLPQTAMLPVASVRGQVTHVPSSALPPLPYVLCGEAYVTPAHDGIASVGATYDSGDTALSAASQADNLARASALVDIESGLPLAGRVGFRPVAPDRLPLVGAVPEAIRGAGKPPERLRDVPRQPGLYCLLGYGSRGVTWAALAAECLAAELDGTPVPLEADLRDALAPGRFLLRQARHSSTSGQ
ncbi:MAG TPA: FAD-dependent 5-carboxymethylaminomethyl-2-thiouridine(34) oxidoreductase MnmC, partial [Burkholderiaceae bacterium]